MTLKKFTLLPLGFLLSACMSANEHREAINTAPSTFTLGKVQNCIRQGAGQDKVLAALGAPNIIALSDDGNEIWVYDKISTEVVFSTSSAGGGATGLLASLASKTLLGSFAGAGAVQGAGAYETTQKTLTVMIKFDRQKLVQAIDYHQSQF